MKNTRITICACSSRLFIDKNKVAKVVTALKHEGYDVNIEADLCRRLMEPSAGITEIASGIIIACHPRAVNSHLHRLGLESKQVIDMRNNSVEEILSPFNIFISTNQELADFQVISLEISELPVEQGTDAWYPVLDKTKCTECGKCHDFCLFGVYSIENKKIKVTQPQNCKNNCPACARMCPSKAIIFPKYEKSPINGGTDIEETFHPDEMDKMYRERLRIKLQERRTGVSLLKEKNNEIR
jgi:MinD superfamily P-loop ATPase containing an inserted ferredoxin domain